MEENDSLRRLTPAERLELAFGAERRRAIAGAVEAAWLGDRPATAARKRNRRSEAAVCDGVAYFAPSILNLRAVRSSVRGAQLREKGYQLEHAPLRHLATLGYELQVGFVRGNRIAEIATHALKAVQSVG
jgi:hypothetical protein